ncbi:uncharacterized protein K452DRAFT_95986 [Aplosporella prunicola CBS 121167]|uniref:Uncharacterized protein n=1 Tax=Aplosporella prunicola CBS 121167 TaxID=1176127 RepID=A0A6A6B5A8_9PEZI|nr:uncharacterized protein K452DRAFT_95986 [Aplosporella prunicola CBS 121167]KAF2138167.1 hypothetical protein K452DRAFT_95986 [Aplosporella prunicola CBS 121167]
MPPNPHPRPHPRSCSLKTHRFLPAGAHGMRLSRPCFRATCATCRRWQRQVRAFCISEDEALALTPEDEALALAPLERGNASGRGRGGGARGGGARKRRESWGSGAYGYGVKTTTTTTTTTTTGTRSKRRRSGSAIASARAGYVRGRWASVLVFRQRDARVAFASLVQRQQQHQQQPKLVLLLKRHKGREWIECCWRG